jgi:hypothetical protein
VEQAEDRRQKGQSAIAPLLDTGDVAADGGARHDPADNDEPDDALHVETFGE